MFTMMSSAEAALWWLYRRPSLILLSDGSHEQPKWQVLCVMGNRSDCEWKLIAEGDTPLKALQSAMSKEARAKSSNANIEFCRLNESENKE